eukprot:gb/GECG01014007.1/.p1 GENE.gb/GECG01014007.1/~~gb/GECG01014007.1/.p1  ORF type:complete len:719 (+),score=97.35 gb/GECG01014007.1/:1-2157(+)
MHGKAISNEKQRREFSPAAAQQAKRTEENMTNRDLAKQLATSLCSEEIECRGIGYGSLPLLQCERPFIFIRQPFWWVEKPAKKKEAKMRALVFAISIDDQENVKVVQEVFDKKDIGSIRKGDFALERRTGSSGSLGHPSITASHLKIVVPRDSQSNEGVSFSDGTQKPREGFLQKATDCGDAGAIRFQQDGARGKQWHYFLCPVHSTTVESFLKECVEIERALRKSTVSRGSSPPSGMGGPPGNQGPSAEPKTCREQSIGESPQASTAAHGGASAEPTTCSGGDTPVESNITSREQNTFQEIPQTSDSVSSFYDHLDRLLASLKGTAIEDMIYSLHMYRQTLLDDMEECAEELLSEDCQTKRTSLRYMCLRTRLEEATCAMSTLIENCDADDSENVLQHLSFMEWNTLCDAMVDRYYEFEREDEDICDGEIRWALLHAVDDFIQTACNVQLTDLSWLKPGSQYIPTGNRKGAMEAIEIMHRVSNHAKMLSFRLSWFFGYTTEHWESERSSQEVGMVFSRYILKYRTTAARRRTPIEREKKYLRDFFMHLVLHLVLNLFRILEGLGRVDVSLPFDDKFADPVVFDKFPLFADGIGMIAEVAWLFQFARSLAKQKSVVETMPLATVLNQVTQKLNEDANYGLKESIQSESYGFREDSKGLAPQRLDLPSLDNLQYMVSKMLKENPIVCRELSALQSAIRSGKNCRALGPLDDVMTSILEF